MKKVTVLGMRDAYSILEDTLKSATSQGPVYYIANSGNWGDALIRYGTRKFLADINLQYIEKSYQGILDQTESFGTEKSMNIYKYWPFSLFKQGTVVYGGGGGWCRLWNHSSDFVTQLSRKFRVIVLPSTYELNYTIPNTTFFCRDMYESKENMPDAIFCHDMAFYIEKEFFRRRGGNGKGYFFRTDEESANRIMVPIINNDISMKGNHLSEISEFFDEIDRFAVIYTDRLHVAIASCLLEKEVHFFPGSYFKNNAVYHSSMKNYFDNIHFHENFDL